MDRAAFLAAQQRKAEIEEELIRLQQEMEEATAGQTFSDHKWNLVDEMIQITGVQAGTVTLIPSDIGSMLSALSLMNEEVLDKVLAPFVDLVDEDPQIEEVEDFIRQAKDRARKTPERFYFRMRAGPNRKDYRSVGDPIELILTPKEISNKVLDRMHMTTEDVIDLELMVRGKKNKRVAVLQLL